MTARYPGAAFRALGKQTEPTMTAHDVVCVHTMVGYLKTTERYFATGNGPGYDGTESHYGIGGKWGADATDGLDGVVWQWQDRGHEADANGEGGRRIISIETADNAPKSAADIAAWSAKQITALVNLIAWECSLAAHAKCPSTWTCRKGVTWEGIKVAIPPVLVPDSKPTRRGLAVHRQGIEHSKGVGAVTGWLVKGGERWSSSRGKECPGDRRVKQFTEVVIPAVQDRIRAQAQPAAPAPTAKPAAAPDPWEELAKMDAKEREKLVADIAAAVASHTMPLMSYASKLLDGRPTASIGELIQHAAAQGIAANGVLKALDVELDTVRAALDALAHEDDTETRQALAAEIASRVDRLRVVVQRDEPTTAE